VGGGEDVNFWGKVKITEGRRGGKATHNECNRKGSQKKGWGYGLGVSTGTWNITCVGHGEYRKQRQTKKVRMVNVKWKGGGGRRGVGSYEKKRRISGLWEGGGMKVSSGVE